MKAPVPENELAEIDTLGLARDPKSKRWVVVMLTTQGTKVLKQELLSEPEERNYATEKLRIKFVEVFMRPKPSDSRS